MPNRRMGWLVVIILLLCAGCLAFTLAHGAATERSLTTTTIVPTTSIPTTSIPPSTTLPPPTSSITTTSIATTTATSTTTSIPTTTTTAPEETVSPILECVDEQADGTFTAHFGYSNGRARSVTIPTGPDNGFTPPPLDRGQPSNFFPGRQVHVFAVSFDGSNLVWTVRSPNGSVWNAAASRGSPRCEPTP